MKIYLCNMMKIHIFPWGWFCLILFMVTRMSYSIFLNQTSGLGVKNQFLSSRRTLVHWESCPNYASLDICSTSDLLFLQKQAQFEKEETCQAISLLQYSLVGGHDLRRLYRRFLLTSLKSAICAFSQPQ